MPKVKLTAAFKFSPDGIRVIEYPAGEHDLEGRALEVAELAGLIDTREADAKRAAKKARDETAAAKQAEEEAAAQAAAAKQAEEEAAAHASDKAASEN